jgi:hypothetical protein
MPAKASHPALDARVPSRDTVAQPGVPAGPCTGSLSIASGVWSYIYINGEKRGTAPTRKPIMLPCGKCELELRLPRGEKFLLQMDIPENRDTLVSVSEKDYR